jgi:hypothetical protein
MMAFVWNIYIILRLPVDVHVKRTSGYFGQIYKCGVLDGVALKVG